MRLSKSERFAGSLVPHAPKDLMLLSETRASADGDGIVYSTVTRKEIVRGLH